MTKKLDVIEPLASYRQYGVFTDFDHYVSGDQFTTAADSTGTCAEDVTVAGGTVKILTAATDNDEVSCSSNALFKFANSLPIVARCRLKMGSVDDTLTNLFFGVTDTAGEVVGDDAIGPAAANNYAGIYTLDSVGAPAGSTAGDFWYGGVSDGTTKQEKVSDSTSVSATWQTLEVRCTPNNAGRQDVTYWIDTAGGNSLSQLVDADGNLIRHSMAYASATMMAAVVYVKAGSAAINTVHLDFVGAWQLRF